MEHPIQAADRLTALPEELLLQGIVRAVDVDSQLRLRAATKSLRSLTDANAQALALHPPGAAALAARLAPPEDRRLGRLTHLSLSLCRAHAPRLLDELGALLAGGGLSTRLKELRLRDVPLGELAHGLSRVAEAGLTSLRVLELATDDWRECILHLQHAVRDVVVPGSITRLSSLRELSLSFSSEHSAAAHADRLPCVHMQALCQLTGLERLSVAGTVADAVPLDALSKLTALTRLELPSWAGACPALAGLTRLEDLRIACVRGQRVPLPGSAGSGSSLRRLDLVRGDPVGGAPAGLLRDTLAGPAPDLRSLNARFMVPDAWGAHDFALLSSLAGLEELTVRAYARDVLPSLTRLARLTRLDLSLHSSTSFRDVDLDPGLLGICGSASGLVELKLELVGGASLSMDMLSTLSALRSLALVGWHPTRAEVSKLRGATGLRALRLERVSPNSMHGDLASDILGAVGALAGLESLHLDLPQVRCLWNKGHHLSVRPLANLVRLKELHLRGLMREVSDFGDLAPLTELRKLCLQYLWFRDAPLALHWLSGMADLRTVELLNLNTPRAVTAADFEPLRELPRLTDLVMRGGQWQTISPDGLVDALGARLCGLHRLHIQDELSCVRLSHGALLVARKFALSVMADLWDSDSDSEEARDAFVGDMAVVLRAGWA